MDLITSMFSGPVLPSTLFLGLMVVWSLLAIAGGLDLNPFGGGELDIDIGGDMDASGGGPSVGNPVAGATDGMILLAMRWLNLRTVPLVIWMGVLAIAWWFVSASLWILIDARFFDSSPGWMLSTLLMARNLAVAFPLTGLMTRPMTGWFLTEQLDSRSLIGRECTISSSEATPDFGQVRFKTDGSPLLLNVRTDGPHLVQGTRVWITHYDAKRRVYIVSPTTTLGDSESPSLLQD